MWRVFFIILLSFLLGHQYTFSQIDENKPYIQDGKIIEQFILKENMTRNLRVIASDEMEGRETGSDGIKKAAKYISNELKSYGIPTLQGSDNYYQEVMFTWIYWDDLYVKLGEETFRHLRDFLAFQDQNADLTDFSANEVLFLGYGIDDEKYSDFAGVDVKNKILLIYKSEPIDKNEQSYISGTSEPSIWNNNIVLKAQTAFKHGAKAILVIEDELRQVLGENRRFLLGPKVVLGHPENNEIKDRANTLLISTNMARDIIGSNFDQLVKVRNQINKKGKPQHLMLPADIQIQMKKKIVSLECNNIISYIEGSDPDLKNEFVVLSAHYDHLGKKGDDIFNGADDNGSGTTTVLEITRAIALAKSLGKGPKRSVLSVWVTGEEKGLLGSQYYVNHPVFPLEQTIANVNIDMVGRIDDIYIDQPNYIYVIGSDKLSSELHQINEEVNEKFVGLKLDYTYNAEDDPNRYYYRSDHYNFAERGIPAIFYFNGTHEDYHRPGDTVDKIDFGKMEKIGRLAFWTVWELANRPNRIKVDVSPIAP